MEINSRAATDKRCKKRKEGYIESRKKDKTIDGFGEEQGRFSDSRRSGMKKGALRLFGSRQTHDFKLPTQRKGGKNAHQETKQRFYKLHY